MQTATRNEVSVAKGKSQQEREPLDQRVNLMVSESWLERAEARAVSMGLALSAYIRMVVENDLKDTDTD